MGEKLKGVLDSVKKALRDAEGGASAEDVTGQEPEIDIEKLKGFVKGFKDQLTKGAGAGIQIHWAVFVTAFIILFSFLGLFSYRLIQSLKDKESKKEQKRKLKEEKRKKK